MSDDPNLSPSWLDGTADTSSQKMPRGYASRAPYLRPAPPVWLAVGVTVAVLAVSLAIIDLIFPW